MALIRVEPDAWQKLAILGAEAADEVTDAPTSGAGAPEGAQPIDLIYHAKREQGGTTRLFKVLQTNACRYACFYCG